MGQELERLNRRIEREISSRKAAEKILEEKALELYQVNEKHKVLNEELEKKVELRSQALIESELRFRTLVESATDVIFNTNNQGIFTYINATGATLYGYSEEEVVGTHLITLPRCLMKRLWRPTSNSKWSEEMEGSYG